MPNTDKPSAVPKQPASKNRTWQALLGAAALLLLIVIVGVMLSRRHTNTNVAGDRAPEPSPTPQITLVPAPLSGQMVPIDIPARSPWAIVIENFPSVRPQSGLSAADIVFEAPTEGGITRFLVFFQSQFPGADIGPVRSARPYFNDWASSFHALYSHSGGTSEALAQLKGGYGALTDVNEFYNADAYARLPEYQAPHNLFTSAERFWNYLIARDIPRTTKVPKLTFTKPKNPGQSAASVTIPYYPAEYRVRYDWREADKSYLRAVGGTTQFDATTNLPLHVTNVLVMVTDITPVPRDPLLKVNLRTTGTGEVILFSRGQRYEGTWSKADLTSPLEFMGEGSEPLPLEPGNTWISVIDKGIADDVKSQP